MASNTQVAIVHEWIEPRGGAERVLDGLASTFPEAKIYALWNHDPERFERGRVVESILARTALPRHKAMALPFQPIVWRRVRASDVETIVVSTHLFAHHVRMPKSPDAKKFTYVHTPARYIWTPALDPRGAGHAARIASAALKPLDRRRALESEALAANSAFIKARIEASWRRDDVEVIYPPVDVARISGEADWAARLTDAEAEELARAGSGFILGASRMVAYKRLDLVIRLGASLGMRVVIAGSGPQAKDLRLLADELGARATFLDSPSDQLLYAAMQRAAVFVFPAIEDFGIVPVEAMAAGCPVVVTHEGGARESVTEGVSGYIAQTQTVGSLMEATQAALRLNREAVAPTVLRFASTRFSRDIRNWVAK